MRINPASLDHNFLMLEDEPERACRECGCTDERGCPPLPGTTESCAWVEEDLCSHCAHDLALLANVATRAAGLGAGYALAQGPSGLLVIESPPETP